MERRDETVLRKVLSELAIAQSMMGDRSFETFDQDEMLKRAVCMTVINIGELVKNLSEECRRSEPSVPWKAVAGFRDIAAHKYQTLRMDDVYHTVTDDFSSLSEKIEGMLRRETGYAP